MSTDECSAEPPQWMLILEKKHLKQHRLAHEIGAGAACIKCGDSCPGLDLHFWRKICRNCKCKKEDHDIIDDDSYLQFEILLNSNGSKARVKPSKAVLDLKLKKEDKLLLSANSKVIKENTEGIAFDWVPPDIPKDLATEYMEQLPPNKMPISGTSGAQHRKQQLEYQIPLHDLTPKVCHNLTPSEIQGFTDYLENVRNNAVGQGRIQKIGMIPQMCIEYSTWCDPLLPVSKTQPLHSSKLDVATNLNSIPKPFVQATYSENISNCENNESSFPPHFLPQHSSDLKTPSEFVKDVNPVKHQIKSNPVQQLNDPSKILRMDLSKPNDISVINDKNKNQILPKSMQSLYSNLNNLKVSDTFNSADNNSPLNNNAAEPLDSLFIKNKVPFCVSNSNQQSLQQPNQSHLQSSHVTSISPSISNQHYTQDPFLPQSQAHPFILQPGFESAPRGYKPDFDNTSTDVKSMNSVEQKPPGSIKSVSPVPEPLKCFNCHQIINLGQVAVLAERAGNNVAWHPQCFTCHTCKELLVDLIYFFHKGNVYCGRHYADMMKIPRCYACDELIFVSEYTVAEGQSFHVRHFCCFECDGELGGKLYISKDSNPLCLDCYYTKYGKKCHTCNEVIAATDQGVCWKHLDWHAKSNCFRCWQCLKSLLESRFVIKNDQPFCNKDCVIKSGF